jgi:ribosome-associated protein
MSDAREPRAVTIRDESIRLGQLLKLAGVAATGGEARELIQDGAVRVNGEVELRRGRQLRAGDVVEALGECLRVNV